MPAVQMTFSLDSSLKTQVDAVYSRIGMNVTDAIRMFLRQSVQVDGLPIATRGCDLKGQDDGITRLTPTESRKLWKLLEETPEEEVEQNYRRLMSKGRNVEIIRGNSDL